MGQTRRTAHPESEASARHIIVAGDVTLDWNLASADGRAGSGAAWTAQSRAEMYCQPGGAALVGGLLAEVGRTLAADDVSVDVSTPTLPPAPYDATDPRLHHSHALWALHPRRKGDAPATIWRVRDFLGLDPAHEPWSPPVTEGAADLVVLDDADLGFREDSEAWPTVLGLTSTEDAAPTPDGTPPWILLKMARPVASGQLWRRLLDRHAKRLIVVMTLNDLRLSDVKISPELSWERIASEVSREVMRHPAVNLLAQCAHVVVLLGTGGAVLLSRPETHDPCAGRLDPPACRVFFDPAAIENSWAEQHPGHMIGYASCLTAGIARELLLDPEAPDIGRGVARGLGAVRTLHLRGFGAAAASVERAGLAFPVADIATALASDSPDFAEAEVPAGASEAWSILEGRYPEGLEPVAEAVALHGVESALRGIPVGKFGPFVTVDRGEIEGFRSIRTLLREYNAEPAPGPSTSPSSALLARASPLALRPSRGPFSTATASRS